MPEKPYEKLLHRELHSHDAKKHYSAHVDLLKDVVNYGTNLIPACLSSSKKSLGDIVIITVLLKQLVMMLDAFQVLVAEACTEAALLQCRALFEASIYIDWILSSDTERKARYYYVANVRRERQWVRRGVPDDKEQKAFFKNLGEFGETLEKTMNRLATFAPDRLKELDEFLEKEPYAATSDDFEKARGNRPYDPPWHAPLGERSVRSICKAVGRLHEYEIFYSSMSEAMHGSRQRSHVKIERGKITLEPIRHLEGLATLLNFTLSSVFHTYREVLQCYRPGQIAEYSKRYIDEWREAFMNIPKVNYQDTSGKPSL